MILNYPDDFRWKGGVYAGTIWRSHHEGKSFDFGRNEVKVGEAAPDFVVLDNDLKPVKLSSYSDQLRIISSVPLWTLRFVILRRENLMKKRSNWVKRFGS